MDNFFKNQLYRWTYEKIKSNPKKFGGDFGNSLIMYEYTISFYSEFGVAELEPQLFSIISTVSRIRNKVLEKNPHFDYRIKYKTQNKNKE
ncbi:hypothetical protein CRU86_05735 [Aliarcobacter skirrowii]|uniref:hypothetical protein n=1 Tax=Aliarcobacter skirrowii TaxID=28200 RepID=UPI00100B9909|nr:hypothetical protein [Aliarcobacter skirrowii]RXJ77404.1 hypothetical protein CRU86_05735 [Aliarcobacter skirrowii]